MCTNSEASGRLRTLTIHLHCGCRTWGLETLAIQLKVIKHSRCALKGAHCLNSLARVILASTRAKRWPTQTRVPSPKAIQLPGTCLFRLCSSGQPSTQRSGMNSIGRSKYLSSRCSVKTGSCA